MKKEKVAHMRKSREKKKMKLGLKIFLTILGIMVVILLGIGAYAGKMYLDVAKTANKMHEPIKKEMRQDTQFRNNVNEIAEQKPFAVLLLGLDTGDFGRNDVGRSDSIIVATVNPKKKETMLVSIPRDTYTEIVGRNVKDKINHAYAFGGVPMAMDTAENLLQIPIDYYASINMEGMEQLVDAVGGIEVNNPFAFKYEGIDFAKGDIHLDGIEALQFSRMRYDDPKGDYGRQDRQRIVLQALAKKALTVASITKYKSILDALGSNIKTNITWDEMKKIESDYRPALGNIKQDFMQGDGVMINDISYQQIPEAELQRVRALLKEQLKE